MHSSEGSCLMGSPPSGGAATPEDNVLERRLKRHMVVRNDGVQ